MQALTLEAIALVEAIAEAGSFAGAAERLYKVPSTVSYAVGQLESRLGVRVFERGGGKVALTPAGAALLAEGRWLLDEAAQLEQRLQQLAGGIESRFRLVTDALVPVTALVPALRDFEALGYGTRMEVGREVLRGAWEALLAGRADLVIAAGDPPGDAGLRVAPLGRVSFGFYVAPDHPLASVGRPLDRRQLAAHVAIVVADSARQLPVRSSGVPAGTRTLTVADPAAKRALQVAGIGHGHLPRPEGDADVRAGRLVELAVREPKPDETLWLASRADRDGECLRWWRDRLATMTPAMLLGG